LQADWEFEVGVDAPVIDACWPGFVDLRATPELAGELAEAAKFSALSRALEKLNGQRSPVWTCKCDFWPTLGSEDFDGDELDAPSGQCGHGAAVYIDLLPKTDGAWSAPDLAEWVARQFCARLSGIPLRSCRADLIIRQAVVTPDLTDLGMTAYITACGATPVDAKRTLESALTAFADALCPDSTLQ
jgi:hypothetical protein